MNAISGTNRVPWLKLRAWIDTHVAYEKEHNQPAPLSTTQLEALSLLVDFDEEPDLDQRDYVSMLNHETQSRRLQPPTFTDSEPISVPCQGKFQPKWRCVCTLNGYGSFPRVNHGVEPGQQEPSFQSKKNAKRYAAKCALQYMQEARAKNAFGPGPSAFAGFAKETPKKVSPPPSKKTVVAKSPSPTHSSPRLEASRSQSSESPAHPRSTMAAGAGSRASSPESDERMFVFQRVADLARMQRLPGPQYHVESEGGEMSKFFRCRATLAGSTAVPADVGVVAGVLGKKEAKEQAALQLLQWLENNDQGREKTFLQCFH